MRDLSYRVYISDALQGIAKGDRRSLKRWADLIMPPEVDTRTADEIAADIITRAGLVFAEDGDTDESI